MSTISSMGYMETRRLNAGTLSSAGFSTAEDLYLNTAAAKSVIMTVSGGAARLTVGSGTVTVASDVLFSAAGTLSVGTLVAVAGSLTSASITGATLNTGTVGTLTVTLASITSASLSTATLGNGTVGTLTVAMASITAASLSTATLGNGTVGTLTVAMATITAASLSTATLGNGTVGTLTVAMASITAASLSTATLGNGTVGTLTVALATLTAATIGSATLNSGTVGTLTVALASLTAATIGSATLSNGTVGTITVTMSTLTTATIGNANVATLSAAYGTITSASLGSCWVGNDLTVSGNLNVLGTRNVINTTETIVEDMSLTLGASNCVTGGSITAAGAGGTITWTFHVPIGQAIPVSAGNYVVILNGLQPGADPRTALHSFDNYRAFKVYSPSLSSGVLTFDLVLPTGDGFYDEIYTAGALVSGCTGDFCVVNKDADILYADKGFNILTATDGTADYLNSAGAYLNFQSGVGWSMAARSNGVEVGFELNLRGTSSAVSFENYKVAAKTALGILYDPNSLGDGDGVFIYKGAPGMTATDGDWRIVKNSAGNVVIQYRASGSWVTKQTIGV